VHAQALLTSAPEQIAGFFDGLALVPPGVVTSED
jgi:hypothetical protein